MDVREFISEWKRMCDSVKDCSECLLFNCTCYLNIGEPVESAENIDNVLWWSKNNPKEE